MLFNHWRCKQKLVKIEIDIDILVFLFFLYWAIWRRLVLTSQLASGFSLSHHCQDFFNTSCDDAAYWSELVSFRVLHRPSWLKIKELSTVLLDISRTLNVIASHSTHKNEAVSIVVHACGDCSCILYRYVFYWIIVTSKYPYSGFFS